MKTRVLHVTAELWPYARTGGLGQAVADIADYQAASGTESHVVLPLYREARAHAGKIEPLTDPFTVESGGRREQVRCWHQVGDDYPKTMFLEHNPSFDRPGLYGDSGGDY
ncbi:MAG TPA: glycogen/starch synthase, partial [Gemmatimonadales bacterium]|nr:glycogen/starch synthase [Gemmatimonadales bacterium]